MSRAAGLRHRGYCSGSRAALPCASRAYRRRPVNPSSTAAVDATQLTRRDIGERPRSTLLGARYCMRYDVPGGRKGSSILIVSEELRVPLTQRRLQLLHVPEFRGVSSHRTCGVPAGPRHDHCIAVREHPAGVVSRSDHERILIECPTKLLECLLALLLSHVLVCSLHEDGGSSFQRVRIERLEQAKCLLRVATPGL